MPTPRHFQFLETPFLTILTILAIVGSVSIGNRIIKYVRQLSIGKRTKPTSSRNLIETPAPPKHDDKAQTLKNRHLEHPDIWWIDDLGRQRQVWLTEDWARSGDANAAIRWVRDGQLKAWLGCGREHPAEYLRRDLEFVLSERFYKVQIFDVILRAAPVIEFEEYAYFTLISKSRIERNEGQLAGMRGCHTVWPAAAHSLFEAMQNAELRDTHIHWDLTFADQVPVFSCNTCLIG